MARSILASLWTTIVRFVHKIDKKGVGIHAVKSLALFEDNTYTSILLGSQQLKAGIDIAIIFGIIID